MLVGMIVNNGIVLVDYTNLLRKRGYRLMEACIEAARSRLRPILMSTLTTIISLVPMAFFPSEGTELVQPISMTVLGGLSFGSLMTLFVMPSLYYIFNAGHERKLRKLNKKIARLEKRPTPENQAKIKKLVAKKERFERVDAEKEEKIVSVAKRDASKESKKSESKKVGIKTRKNDFSNSELNEKTSDGSSNADSENKTKED